MTTRKFGPVAGPALILAAGLAVALAGCSQTRPVRMTKDALRDKIRGGWAGQVIGCTFGGPTEFRFKGTFIQDYQPLTWDPGAVARAMRDEPGLFDDVYVDLTFVEVLRREGLDAPASAFARAFAEAPYPLWHANRAARYNILSGLEPPASGAWPNNPHADDIDFQIEADFAGLMSPGMVGPAAEICDRVGHIMNSGDGWYGGVYVAAMYALAFVSDNPEVIAREALKVIPEGTAFHAAMSDVLRWHAENPDDWHGTWFRVQRKWSEDVGCPEGVFSPFDIDAKVNAAWVLTGLLYGQGDFARTLEISARCGDDSDCNPATAGGILGTALGWSRIPEVWRAGLGEAEAAGFPFTNHSLSKVYDLSFEQALEMIRRNGGRVLDTEVLIEPGEVRPVRREVNFPGLRPVEKRPLLVEPTGPYALDFDGCGVAVTANLRVEGPERPTLLVRASVDGGPVSTVEVPTGPLVRRDPLYWAYDLPDGPHRVVLEIVNASETAGLVLCHAVVYRPASPPAR